VKAELLCAYVNYGVVDSAGLVCRFLNWKTAVFSSKTTQNWYVVFWQFCDGLHCNMWDIIQIYEDSIIYKVTTKNIRQLTYTELFNWRLSVFREDRDIWYHSWDSRRLTSVLVCCSRLLCSPICHISKTGCCLLWVSLTLCRVWYVV